MTKIVQAKLFFILNTATDFEFTNWLSLNLHFFWLILNKHLATDR